MKTDRLLLAALILSVAVNLLLAGVFMGRLAGPERSAGPVDPMMGMRRLIRDLPEERAEALGEQYRNYFATVRPRFRELRAAQRQLRSAILTDPLDREAVRGAMIGLQDQLRDSQGVAHDTFIELIAALTLEERHQLIAFMSPPPRHGRPKGERPPPDQAGKDWKRDTASETTPRFNSGSAASAPTEDHQRP